MNENFTIVPNSYKCQGCGQVGDTPLEIKHEKDCPTVEAETRRRIVATIREGISSQITHMGQMNGWPGAAPIAEAVYLRLKRDGFIK